MGFYHIGLSSMAGERSLGHDRAPSGRDLIFKACNYKTEMYRFKTNALIKISVSVFEFKKNNIWSCKYSLLRNNWGWLRQPTWQVPNMREILLQLVKAIIMSSNVCKISFFILTEIVTNSFCRNWTKIFLPHPFDHLRRWDYGPRAAPIYPVVMPRA